MHAPKLKTLSLLVLIAGVAVGLDQWSKRWADRWLAHQDHPIPIPIEDADRGQSIDDLLARMFPAWPDATVKEAVDRHVFALQTRRRFKPDEPVPRSIRVYVFLRKRLDTSPRLVVENHLVFIERWLREIAGMDGGQKKKWVSRYAKGRTFRALLQDQWPRLSDEEAARLVTEHTFALRRAPVRSGHTVSAGEIYVLTHRRVEVIPNFFRLSYTENPGAAWGFLANAPEGFRRVFFLVISILAIVALSYLVLKSKGLAFGVAYSLIIGGAVGNLIDRLRFNYVIDFIDWHWYDRLRWPTFNIADIAITGGAALLIIIMIRQRRQEKSQREDDIGDASSIQARSD